jgi:hypothetical protein
MSAKDKYAEVRRLKAAMEDARWAARDERCERYETWLTKLIGVNPIGKWLTVNFGENDNPRFPRLIGGGVTLIRATGVVFDYSPCLEASVALPLFDDGKPILIKSTDYKRCESIRKYWGSGFHFDYEGLRLARGNLLTKNDNYKLQIATKQEISGEALHYRLRIITDKMRKDKEPATIENLYFDTFEAAKKRLDSMVTSWRKKGGKAEFSFGRVLWFSIPNECATHEAGIQLVRR